MRSFGSILCLLVLTESINSELYRLTSADNKGFYVDDKPRTWKDSQIFCNSEGMRLASITSYEQFRALNEAVQFQTFFSYYWTAGRDSQDITQFAWDGPEHRLLGHESVPFKKFPFVPYQTCVAFNTQLKHQSYLFYDKCTSLYGAICEMPTYSWGT